MKGIILAGGLGTRLHPITRTISKQLLPIYDKPMIYYPLSILMLAGIKEILIISSSKDIKNYKLLLGDGSKLGMNFSYKVQPYPEGLAQAFILGEKFIGDDNVCLILGDNLFYGAKLPLLLKECVIEVENNKIAIVFGYYVNDPKRYGIIDFDNKNNILNIEEKPNKPKSNYAVSGLYFYPNDVVEISKKQKLSSRGELEITDTNNSFLGQGRLKAKQMSRGYTWLDMGTHKSLLEASQFVYTLETRQGMKISCIEEIAFHLGYINNKQLRKLGAEMSDNEYGKYLIKISNNF